MPRLPFLDYKICCVFKHLRYSQTLRMDLLDLLIALLNFFAPALVVAPLVALAARATFRKSLESFSWWSHIAINSIAGGVILAGGLVHFGRDGKMLTYVAMVLAVATAQWLTLRGWRE